MVASLAPSLRYRIGVCAVYVVRKEPKQPLEVGRDEDVHSRAQCLLDSALVCLGAILRNAALGLLSVHRLLLVLAGLPEAVQDVVLVCSNDQLLSR